MRLTQTELDRVLIFCAAEMARRRLARGIRLNHPEAVALITDEMMEKAREGASYPEVRSHGQSLLSPDDVLPGVPELVQGLRCEPLFDDGPRLIVLSEPIARSTGEHPGQQLLRGEPITLNAGRDVITLRVRNTSDHVVIVTSHYHFFEVNLRMKFDRARSYGRRLDLQAGRALIWQPGEERSVDLVPYAGARTMDGFQLIPPPEQKD